STGYPARYPQQKDASYPAMHVHEPPPKATEKLPGSSKQCQHSTGDVQEQSPPARPVAIEGRWVVVQVVVEDVLQNETDRQDDDPRPGKDGDSSAYFVG